MGNFRFSKKEKLTGKKIIDDLFAKGASRRVFPLKLVSLRHPNQGLRWHQVLISVPARNFRKAVDRNTLKRRIREGYRLNKALVSAPPAFCLAYIYIAKEILPSPDIHKAIRSSLEALNANHEKD